MASPLPYPLSVTYLAENILFSADCCSLVVCMPFPDLRILLSIYSVNSGFCAIQSPLSRKTSGLNRLYEYALTYYALKNTQQRVIIPHTEAEDLSDGISSRYLSEFALIHQVIPYSYYSLFSLTAMCN